MNINYQNENPFHSVFSEILLEQTKIENSIKQLDNQYNREYLESTVNNLISKIFNGNLKNDEANEIYNELNILDDIIGQNKHILKNNKKTLFFDDIYENFGTSRDNIKLNCKKIGCVYLATPLDNIGLAIILLKIHLNKINTIYFDWDRTLSLMEGFEGKHITNNDILLDEKHIFLGSELRQKLINYIFNSNIDIIIISANKSVTFNQNPVKILLRSIGVDTNNINFIYSPWDGNISQKMNRIL